MDERELLDLYEARGGEELYDAAKVAYDAALAEAPEDPLLLRDYGYLLECHGRRTLEAALAAYERALELDPGSEKTLLQLLHAQASLGRHDEAIARCLHPDDAFGHRCLATAYLGAGDLARAAQTVADGLALAPGDAGLIELDGDVLARTGNPEEALTRWRRALELDPGNLSPSYSSAFLLQREGRVEEAAAQWREIVSWCEARGYELDAEWPRRELARLAPG